MVAQALVIAPSQMYPDVPVPGVAVANRRLAVAVAKALTMLPRCRAVLTDMLGPAYRFWGAVSTPIGDAPVPGAAVAKDPTADPT